MTPEEEKLRSRMLEARAAMRRLTQACANGDQTLYGRLSGLREDLEAEINQWHDARGMDRP